MKVTVLIILYLIFASSFYACSTYYGETKLDKNWGTSFETARQSQILNPEPADPTAPVEGMDGTASGKVMDNYHESFGGGSPDETVNIIKLR